MKSILLASLCMMIFQLQAQNLLLSGTIGAYPIEVEITKSTWETGEITGKYKYLSKLKYIHVSGQVTGNCIRLVEVYKGDTTGTFYLEVEGDTLMGKWLSKEKYYDTKLLIVSGDKSMLKAKTVDDYKAQVSGEITGSYETETFFLNDMFLSESNVEMEIGYNGGTFLAKKLAGDSIQYQVFVVCGPTYHIAMAEGIAVKNINNQKYVSIIDDYDSENPCVVTIEFSEKEVYVSATYNQTCGFGARAYLDHHFTKTNDKVEFKDY